MRLVFVVLQAIFLFPTSFCLIFPFVFTVLGRPALDGRFPASISGDGEPKVDWQKCRANLGELFHVIYTLFFDFYAR